MKRLSMLVVLVLMLAMIGCSFDREESPRRVINYGDSTIYITEIDGHEYVHPHRGGIVHKVGCKGCQPGEPTASQTDAE